MSAIDALLAKNAAYAEGFSHGDLDAMPGRELAVVSCMDARLVTGRLLGLSEGDVHVLRNAGGIVTEDTLRSLTISQRLLGTREVMIVQHTRCGMATFEGEAFRSEIEAETGVRPPFEMGTFSDLETSVRDSMKKVKTCPFLPHTDQVRGFVYAVESGRLTEVR